MWGQTWGQNAPQTKKALSAEAVRALYLLVGSRGFEPPTTCTPCKSHVPHKDKAPCQGPPARTFIERLQEASRMAALSSWSISNHAASACDAAAIGPMFSWPLPQYLPQSSIIRRPRSSWSRRRYAATVCEAMM
jgi:hypothetical protein